MSDLSPACPHCKSALTENHCENPQCDWIRCTNCRMVTRIVNA